MRWNEERQVSIYGDSLYYASTGDPGTTYPIGTKDNPCSSLANLKTIAAAFGIKNIILLTDITLNATVTSGLSLIGQDSVKIVTLNSQIIDGVSFVGLSLVGVQGAAAAGVYCYKCSINATIDTLTANQCSLNAVTVVAGGELILSSCSAETATSTITCSGTGAVTVSDFTGNLVLAASLAGDVIILTGMDGSISIGAGCAAGAITIYGDVKVTDASTGATVLDYSTHTHLGEMGATATADDLSNITTTAAMAKLRRILLRFSSDAFAATVNGTSRTDIESMVIGLASYITAAGAALAATVNPGGTSKNNVEEILEDLGIMLAGGAGIITWPGSVKWGNGVSFAEALAFASDEAEIIHTEVETTTLATGAGSNATLSRAGLLLRYLTDSVATGNKVIIQDTPAGSSTVVTASEITEGLNFWKGALLLATSGANAGQARPIISSVAATSVTVFPAFDANIAQNDTCVIISAWRPDVWNQQADVALNTTATNGAETSLFNLSQAGYTYMVNNLRVKCADPGANTVTVRLYELINDVQTEVDSFAIDTTNYTTYYSLMDMFGIDKLVGNQLVVTVRASAGGPYTVTGQYHYAVAITG
jgi:hypothetical protein